MKYLISVPLLLSSLVACSSESPSDSAGSPSGTAGANGSGTAGSNNSGQQLGGGGGGAGNSTQLGGNGQQTGGTTGVSGSPGTGGLTQGTGMSGGGGNTTTGQGMPSGGTGMSANNATGQGGMGMSGAAGATGAPETGGASGGGMAGMSTGGSGMAEGGAGGSDGSGTSGPSASFQCANLTLAPSTTGVAEPSGAAGGLKVLDWAGFDGAASFTFDDNTPSQMQNYDALKATGGHFTWFVVGSWLSGQSSTISQYKATIDDGQEMASHTYSHNSNGSQGDLEQNEQFITDNFGVNADSMAAPNCNASWAGVAPSVLFQNRGPCGKGIQTVSPRDNTDPFQLPAYLPDTGESGDSLRNAITGGQWRIFVIHGFDSQGGTYQPVPIANVTSAMSSAVMDGFWVEGMTAVGAYWQGQKLIPESADTSATWTLPDKFPPNMCVRITTTGGTVTQNGETIPWDDHGYYEISLDAGEVTIQ